MQYRVLGSQGPRVSALGLGWGLGRDQLSEAMAALEISLSAKQLAEIEGLVPAGAAAGARYPEAQLAHMDSERRSTGSD